MPGYKSVMWDASQIGSEVDAASSAINTHHASWGTAVTANSKAVVAQAAAASAQSVADVAAGKASDASSAVASRSANWDKASDALSKATIAASNASHFKAGTVSQILVGGGAGAAPVWTLATGVAGAPVRATSPVLVTPTLGVAAATSLTTPTINGGIAANDDITIQGTTDGTRTTSYVNLQPNGGNVGIGTTSPNAKLESMNTTEPLRLSYSAAAYASFTLDSSGSLQIAPTGTRTTFTKNLAGRDDDSYFAWDAASDRIGFMKKGGSFGKLAYGSASSFAITQSNAATIAAAGTFTDRLVIDSSGNVGIGTTEPTLENNAVVKELTISRLGDPSLSTLNLQGQRSGTIDRVGTINTWNNTSNISRLNFALGGDTTSGAFSFQTSISGGALTERVKIGATGLLSVTVPSGYSATFMGGNVGIGTTTPANTLSLPSAGIIGFEASVGVNDNLIGRAGATALYVSKGLHVGGTSDPGDNNLLVDGTIICETSGCIFRGAAAGTTDLIIKSMKTDGTIEGAAIALYTSSTLQVGNIVAFDQDYTTSGPYMADALVVRGLRAGGLNLTAENATGDIRFYPGGVAVAATIDHHGNVGIGTVAPATTLSVNGGYTGKITNVTATYQILVTDYTIVCNHATVAFTATLLAAGATTIGQIFNIKNIGAAIVSVAPSGTNTTDGTTTPVALAQYDSLTVQCNTATSWIIL